MIALTATWASLGFLFIMEAREAQVTAATLTVTKTTDTDDGVCDGDCGLREAIAAAAPGDTIVFSSLFDTPQTVRLVGIQLAIGKDLTIIGPGADKLTISADNHSRVIHVQTLARVSLSGMTITGGNAGHGGGIFNEGTVTVVDCHVTGNAAGSGGGIGSLFGATTVLNSAISDNSAQLRGGGIWHDSPLGHRLTIINSTVSGNTVTDTFGEGGGIWTTAVVFAGFPDVRIWSSTVTNNASGGIYVAGQGRADVFSSIVAANHDNSVVPDVVGSVTNSGYNLIGNGDAADGPYTVAAPSIIGNSVVQADPKLGPLAFNGGPTPTHALLPCSLATDRGKNLAQASDQRGDGFSRTVDSSAIPNAIDGDGSDIGAFEVQTFAPAVCNTGPPAISATDLALQQATSARMQIATIGDADGLFGVGVLVSSANPSNGVRLSNIGMDSLGTISGDVAASCTASTEHFTLTAHDGELAASDTLTVTVTPETTPPVLTVGTNPIALFPNDHKYRTVNVSALVVLARDECDPSVSPDSVFIDRVTSDEADNAPGSDDGNTVDDIVIAPDCRSVQLRAERDRNGDGRVYTISMRVRDAAGNTTIATRHVTVPLSQHHASIDGGPQLTVTGGCR